MITAVLFDLFETLISESGLEPTRASHLGQTLGLDNEAFRLEWKTRRSRIVLGQLSFVEALTEISQTLTGTVNAAAIQRLAEQRIREKAGAYERIDRDVMELVTDLRSRGLRLAVISNCFQEDAIGWWTCPLAREFQCAVFSFAEGLAKPNPEIYLRAIRCLRVDPAAAVFVGDGGDNEIAGAAQAGLRAFRSTWFVRKPPRFQASDAGGCDLPNCRDVLKLVAAG
jgi:HAD superfamily hydrolase (TIGR01509 family)